MVCPENNKTSSDNRNVNENENIVDEVSLANYFLVLWKHKWFIAAASVLPAVIVVLVLFFGRTTYEMTYVYDVSTMQLNEKEYTVFVTRFFSEKNIHKILDQLREKGLNMYAQQLAAAGKSEGFKKLITMTPFPEYPVLSAKGMTPAQTAQAEANLLMVTIASDRKDALPKVSMVIRDNLENVFPLAEIRGQLTDEILVYNQKLAKLEDVRFSKSLDLKTMNSSLKKLKAMTPLEQDDGESRVVLQFDISDRGQYLPLKYQIRALESEIVDLEKTIETNEENYTYYTALLDLNQNLLTTLNEKMGPSYTIQQYHAYLVTLADKYETSELKDYLSSYIRKVEDQIAVSAPVSENPYAFTGSKGTVKKAGIAFLIALLFSVFASFILEDIEKR